MVLALHFVLTDTGVGLALKSVEGMALPLWG